MAFDESISGYLFLDCTLGIFYACLDIVLWHWYDWLSWLGLRMLLFLYFIASLVWYIDMPIIIDCSSCLAWYSDSVSSLLFCSLHMHRLTIVHRLTCCVVFFGLYILLIVFGHGVLITIHPDCHGLYVYMSDISCTLPDCMLHDYPSSAWLHVACSCGSHIYSPTSNSLGLGHFLHFSSHFCKCEAFCVFAPWPSQRLGVGSSDGLYRCTGAFWRWPAHWCREESDHWRPV